MGIESFQYLACGVIVAFFQLATILVMFYVCKKRKDIWKKPTILLLLICINLTQPTDILFCWHSYHDNRIGSFIFDQCVTCLRDEVLLLTAQRLAYMLERAVSLARISRLFVQCVIVAHFVLYFADTVIECYLYRAGLERNYRITYWVYAWPSQIGVLAVYLWILRIYWATFSYVLQRRFKLGLVLLAVGQALRIILNVVTTPFNGQGQGIKELVLEIAVESALFYFLVIVVQEGRHVRKSIEGTPTETLKSSRNGVNSVILN